MLFYLKISLDFYVVIIIAFAYMKNKSSLALHVTNMNFSPPYERLYIIARSTISIEV